MKLSGAVVGLFTSIGVALVMTAALAPGRQTPAVLSSGLQGVAGLEHAALGQ